MSFEVGQGPRLYDPASFQVPGSILGGGDDMEEPKGGIDLETPKRLWNCDYERSPCEEASGTIWSVVETD